MSKPPHFALDFQDGIYWSGWGHSLLRCADLDGSDQQVFYPQYVGAVALDPLHAKLYWTVPGKIQRANLDGSEIEDIATGVSYAGSSIAVDGIRRKVYWAHMGQIRCTNLDGSGSAIIQSGEVNVQGLAVDSDEGKLYWTVAWQQDFASVGFTSGLVRRANLDGSQEETLHDNFLRPRGITLGSASLLEPPGLGDPPPELPYEPSGGIEATQSLTWGQLRAHSVLPCFPNPFRHETWLPFRLVETAEVHIEIYDVQGKRVRVLRLGQRAAGEYLPGSGAPYFDGRNASGDMLASGTYFYCLKAGDFAATRCMSLQK